MDKNLSQDDFAQMVIDENLRSFSDVGHYQMSN